MFSAALLSAPMATLAELIVQLVPLKHATRRLCSQPRSFQLPFATCVAQSSLLESLGSPEAQKVTVSALIIPACARVILPPL